MGPGGGFFMTIYQQSTGKVQVLNARERDSIYIKTSKLLAPVVSFTELVYGPFGQSRDFLTAIIFENEPMPTPWKFLDSLPVIPSC